MAMIAAFVLPPTQSAAGGLFFMRCAACPQAPVHSCDIDAPKLVF